jgi:hypothetical protein
MRTPANDHFRGSDNKPSQEIILPVDLGPSHGRKRRVIMEKYQFPLMDYNGNDFLGHVDDQGNLVISDMQNGQELYTVPGRVCYKPERCRDLAKDMEQEVGVRIPFAVFAEDEKARDILKENGFFIVMGAGKGDGLVFPITKVGMPALRDYLRTVRAMNIPYDAPMPA